MESNEKNEELIIEIKKTDDCTKIKSECHGGDRIQFDYQGYMFDYYAMDSIIITS